MKNMITEMNLNWLEAAGASTRRNNITSMSAGPRVIQFAFKLNF